jgi:hypothetical protein
MRFGDFSCTATILWLIWVCLLHHSSKRWIKPEASGFGFFFTCGSVTGGDTSLGAWHRHARTRNENLAELVSVAIMEGFPKSIARFCTRSTGAEKPEQKNRRREESNYKRSTSIAIVRAEKIQT